MANLSPLAQEVIRVYSLDSKWIGDKMPRPRYKAIADVLRAIVKHYNEEDEMRRYMSLDGLLSVADELDAASQGESDD